MDKNKNAMRNKRKNKKNHQIEIMENQMKYNVKKGREQKKETPSTSILIALIHLVYNKENKYQEES